MDNTGSFGSAAGGVSPELQAAIQRRAGGNPSGPTGQVTAGSPTFNPATQPSSAPPMPTPTGGASTPPSLPGGAGMGAPMESSESQLIIKALDQRLRSISAIQKGGGGI